MRTVKNAEGFTVVEEEKYTEANRYTRLLEESPEIGDYEEPFNKPGSSHLRVGRDHHWNREQVKELTGRMNFWLKNKRLKGDRGLSQRQIIIAERASMDKMLTSDTEGLAPGSISEIDGPEGEQILKLIITEEELVQIAKYWSSRTLENAYCCFAYGEKYRNDDRLIAYIQNRLNRAGKFLSQSEFNELIADSERIVKEKHKVFDDDWTVFKAKFSMRDPNPDRAAESSTTGCIGNLNPTAARDIPEFIATHHELLQVAKYWAAIVIEHTYFLSESRPLSSHDFFGLGRISDIANLIGEDEGAIYEEVGNDFGKSQDPESWDRFLHGATRQWDLVPGESDSQSDKRPSGGKKRKRKKH